MQPASAGFVCVDAVSTAGFFLTREGGFRLCRRGFNRRVYDPNQTDAIRRSIAL